MCVGTCRIWKNLMQENFGLIFRSLCLELAEVGAWKVLVRVVLHIPRRWVWQRRTSVPLMNTSGTQSPQELLALGNQVRGTCVYWTYGNGHNLNQWAKKRSKPQNFPSSIVKHYPENPHTWCGGFSRFHVLSSFLGQKSCRTKVSRIFRIFVPNFAPNFAPNFPRIFRGLFVLRFVGGGDQKKIHQKSPAIFQCKIPRQTRKKYSQNSSGKKRQRNLSHLCLFLP